MTADVTDILRQTIISQFQNQPPDDQYIPDATGSSPSDNFMTTVNGVVGTAANYAQLISLLPNTVSERNIWQAVANDPAVQQALNNNDTAGGVAAATGAASTAASGAIGGIIVLYFSLLISFVSDLIGGSTGEDDSSLLLKNMYEYVIGTYDSAKYSNWAITTNNVDSYVIPVYGDLQEITTRWQPPISDPIIEYTVAQPEDILKTKINDYAYSDHVRDLVNACMFDPTPWYAPYDPNIIFLPDIITVPLISVYPPITSIGWWGDLPNPSVPNPTGGALVFAPQFILKAFMYALQSWCTINSVAIKINPVPTSTYPHQQQTFSEVLQDLNSNGILTCWGDFLLDKYTTAISGLVKSALPTDYEIILFYMVFSNPEFIDSLGVPFWNLVYGVVDIYAQFDQPISPPSIASSHIIDWLLEIQYVLDNLTDQTLAKVRARVMLKLMARWKTLYLLHGYDKVWSILQNLRSLANRPPDNEPLLQDGTKANGNWSVRELYNTILTVSPALAPPGLSEPSVGNLITLFNWIGSFEVLIDTVRPVSFRDSLTNAAL